jgi:hypothetical protein
MKVLIIGVGHKLQEAKGAKDSSLIRSWKDLFERLLKQRIDDADVAFIGEETRFIDDEGTDSIETTAKTIALDRGLLWRNIDCTSSAKMALGIAKEQKAHPSMEQLGVGFVFREKRVTSDAIREEYMVWRAQLDAANVDSILLICGNLHVEQLATRFRRDGLQVETDYFCNYAQ